MPSSCRVLLTLSSSPRNVLVVRHALGGVAEAMGLGPLEGNDVYTAVTEACNNVVMHAYGGGEGPMRVELVSSGVALTATVSDEGAGLRQMPDEEHSGLGLHLIRAITERVWIERRPTGGTRLRMLFAIAPEGLAVLPVAAPVEDRLEGPDGDEVTVVCSSRALADRVLPRALAALAAGMSFSSAGLRDVELLGAWLARNAAEEELTVSVRPALRELALWLHPYAPELGDGMRGAAGELLLEMIATSPEASVSAVRADHSLGLRIAQPALRR